MLPLRNNQVNFAIIDIIFVLKLLKIILLKESFKMNVITVLCVICIGIELINILLCRPVGVISINIKKWFKTFDMYKCFTKGVTVYCNNYSENIDNLSKVLSKEELDIFKMKMKDFVYDEVIDKNVPKKLFENMIKSIGPIRLALYGFHQIVNLIYWGIAFALMFILPVPAGIILFVLLTGLSIIQSRNTSRIPCLYWIDSFVCIMMFLMVLFVF